MKALVYHKASLRLADGSVGSLLMAQIRDFVCFNGFNVANAFTVGAGGDTDFILVVRPDGRPNLAVSQGNGALSTGLGRITAQHPGCAIGQWECVGIGWVHENVDQNLSWWTSAAQGRKYKECLVLNQETGFPGYYDGTQDQWRPTKRERTPNEIYIGTALLDVQRGVALPDALRTSRMLRVLAYGYKVNHLMTDFVGSERNSGLAVAYLQVFRNTSRMFMGSQSTAMAEMLNTMRAAPGLESLIPFMSSLCHNGGDSDILSHVGPVALPVMAAQAAKWGVFSLAEFFGNNESMIREGRYNKGAQSDNLGRKLRTAKSHHNWPEATATAWQRLTESLRSLIDSGRGVEALLTMAQVHQRGIDDYRRRINEALDAMARIGTPLTARNNLTELCNEHAVDFRAPVRPSPPVSQDTSRIDGASTGFAQWINSNNGRFGNTTTRVQTEADRRRLEARTAAGVPV